MPVTDKTVRVLRRVYMDRLTSIDQYVIFMEQYGEASRLALNSQLSAMQEDKVAFMSARDKLLNDWDECDEAQLRKKRDEFNNKFNTVRGFLLDKLNAGDGGRPLANSTTMSHTLSTSSQLRLPKIELPSFAGDHTQWISFKDRFTAMVHDQMELSETVKLQYLVSSLKGEAATVFEHVQLTEGNYATTWEALLTRYDDSKTLRREYFKALVDLDAMTGPSPEELLRIVNESRRLVHGMERLKEPVASWDTPLSSLVRYKLDETTLMAYELLTADQKDDTFEGLMEFCEKRIKVLTNAVVTKRNAIETRSAVLHRGGRPDQVTSRPAAGRSVRNGSTAAALCAEQGPRRPVRGCEACHEDHPVSRCTKFAKMTVMDRQRVVKDAALCFKCLGGGHQARFCRVGEECGRCKRQHHTLVCTRYGSTGTKQEARIAATMQAEGVKDGWVWLSTALVVLSNEKGMELPARALLDGGSQANFISERLVQQLQLRKRRLSKPLSGIGAVSLRAESMVTTTMKSRVSDFVASLNCLVLPSVTARVPARTRATQYWKVPVGLTLADPAFANSDGIDLLIGAEFVADLLQQGRVRLAPNLPLLLETRLGWIVSGKEEVPCEVVTDMACSCVGENDVADLMKKLVELEAVPEERVLSMEDEECERWFLKTTCRTEEGRYEVRLPKIEKFQRLLGDSLPAASRRFKTLERRLNADGNLKAAYTEFMAEYIRLGHMSKLSADDDKRADGSPRFYLPHHAVWKAGSKTSKCRVVFDASCRCSTGRCLNNVLLTGPKLQDDLVEILLRFRMKPVALVADVEKMYRQVLVSGEDRDLQRILWRSDASEELAVYQLNTVTYGTACAPYLAIRTLRKIFEDEGAGYPKAIESMNDFYVDDLLSGANSKEEAAEKAGQLNELLEKGGFSLRKWASNQPEALATIPTGFIAVNTQHELAVEADNNSVSTLGLLWTPSFDRLQLQVRRPDDGDEKCTKRQVLACIARIYDPLGFVDPVKMKAKLFMQQIWALKDNRGKPWGWDDELPGKVLQDWAAFYPQLRTLADVAVPRTAISTTDGLQCHVFVDASEKGYGACCYLRSNSSPKEVAIRLMVSKSKVAPLAQRLTIARLELCAALLGSNVFRTVKKVLPSGVKVFLWTDSTTVWHWIQSPHNNWKTFVANRTAKIQRLTEGCQWRHVPGLDNPADLVSRGCDPNDLLQARQWWSWPSWLNAAEEDWPALPVQKAAELTGEERASTVAVSAVDGDSGSAWVFARYSTVTRLRRVVGYCLRYLRALRTRSKEPSQKGKVIAPLSAEELRKADLVLCRMAQVDHFADELKMLKGNSRVARTSPLKECSPFVDEEGVIRANGRLRNATIDTATKYPIVIPKKHPLARMLAAHQHIKLLHGGPQLMLSSLRQRYWLLGARAVVRKVYHECVRCFRCKPKVITQPMGDLPLSRVREARPFAVSGVDYCGPVYLKGSHRRAVPVKAFIAVFVCFVTRAVHLELVSDLSTAAFLAALRRFVARRGLVSEIHSDNGTNFKGAANELHRVYELLSSAEHRKQVVTWSAEKEIMWCFIPPRAPHFGGLWEAAVKAMKRHLQRVVGSASMSQEDMLTLLAEVESCLNSRPITPMSNDPSDFEALTPGHFLTGSNMQQVQEVDLRHITGNRLNHWRMVQQKGQQFWDRWHVEYLQQLHARRKWKGSATPIEVGMMVIIREDNVPPLKWPVGRITEVHPGQDGVVRVVTLRTAHASNVKRSVSRISILPVEDKGSSH